MASEYKFLCTSQTLNEVYEVNARIGVWGFVDSCSADKTVESTVDKFIFTQKD
jgi:hypothetical protein